jgi:hypothetical protein
MVNITRPTTIVMMPKEKLESWITEPNQPKRPPKNA